MQKKCEETVIQERKFSIKNATGEFEEHRVEKAKLEFEVTYCFKCKRQGMSHLTAKTKIQQKLLADVWSHTEGKTVLFRIASSNA